MTPETTTITHDGERGQTLVEYALIIALVSLAAIAALGFLNGRIQAVFSKAGNSLAAVCVSNPDGSCDSDAGGTPSCAGTTVPECGSVVINNLGGGSQAGFDDGDSLQAETTGWTNSPTSWTFVWSRDSTSGATCPISSTGNVGTDVSSDNLSQSGPDEQPGNADAGDPLLVVVTATNGSGTSTETATACVYVLD